MKNYVRENRIRLNLTQKDLANMIGVSRQTIHSIESNKFEAGLETALKLARVLQRNIHDIFRDKRKIIAVIGRPGSGKTKYIKVILKSYVKPIFFNGFGLSDLKLINKENDVIVIDEIPDVTNYIKSLLNSDMISYRVPYTSNQTNFYTPDIILESNLLTKDDLEEFKSINNCELIIINL